MSAAQPALRQHTLLSLNTCGISSFLRPVILVYPHRPPRQPSTEEIFPSCPHAAPVHPTTTRTQPF
jgi:hypothetical protein